MRRGQGGGGGGPLPHREQGGPRQEGLESHLTTLTLGVHVPACSSWQARAQLPSPEGPGCMVPEVGSQRWARPLSVSFLLSKWLRDWGCEHGGLVLALRLRGRAGLLMSLLPHLGPWMKVTLFSGPWGPWEGEGADQHPGTPRGCQPGKSELNGSEDWTRAAS